jgi:hypothetical protein
LIGLKGEVGTQGFQGVQGDKGQQVRIKNVIINFTYNFNLLFNNRVLLELREFKVYKDEQVSFIKSKKKLKNLIKTIYVGPPGVAGSHGQKGERGEIGLAVSA